MICSLLSFCCTSIAAFRLVLHGTGRGASAWSGRAAGAQVLCAASKQLQSLQIVIPEIAHGNACAYMLMTNLVAIVEGVKAKGSQERIFPVICKHRLYITNSRCP